MGLMALDIVIKNGTNTGTEATPSTRRSVLREQEAWLAARQSLQTRLRLAVGIKSSCKKTLIGVCLKHPDFFPGSPPKFFHMED